MSRRRTSFSLVLFLLVATYLGSYVLYRQTGAAAMTYPKDGGLPTMVVSRDGAAGGFFYSAFRPCLLLEEYYYRMNYSPVG